MMGWFFTVLLLLAVAAWVFIAWVIPMRRLRDGVREIILIQGSVPSKTRGLTNQIWRDLRTIESRTREINRQTQDEGFSLKTILAGMVEGVIITDTRGVVQVANAAFQQMFGLEADPAGRYVMDVLRQPETKRLIDHVLVSGKEASDEVVIEDLLDTRSPRKVFQVSVSPLGADNTKITGAVAVFHDISRIVRLEELRREFVANVSHELRTPLAIFRGYLENLLDNAELPPEEQVRVLQVMKRHSDRLNALVDDLLTLSRLESGQIRLDFADLSVPRLLQQLCEDWKLQAESRKCELVWVAPENMPLLQADPLRLEQVYYNLLDNALKYSGKEGRVEVGVLYGKEPSCADFYVRDYGNGIPSDKIEHIFQRFYRVDRARSREHGGTGLGLAIVKHIVQLHGGRVWAESKLGKGTTIWFRLPMVQDGSVVPELPGHERPPTVPSAHAL